MEKNNNRIAEVHGDDYSFLRLNEAQRNNNYIKTINIVDLFCGCGGISLGIQEACRELNFGFTVGLAVDFDQQAYECYKQNFNNANVLNEDISNVFSLNLGGPATDTEKKILKNIGPVDILVGGPPCQGHSDLNNFARRNDPKNQLYLYMARAAELLSPEHIIIENVVGAIHDKGKVVQKVSSFLEKLGYHVSSGNVNLVNIGVPQNRKRLILIASKMRDVEVGRIEEKYALEKKTVGWAISDLVDYENKKSLLDTPSTPSKDNKMRIEYLFDNNLYELPNEKRPPCHSNKEHSYNTIYGRLSWDKPSQTITRGFYSMCMGRYVHPSKARTLTAHEAARLQFFPDFFDFSTVRNRTSLAKIIGNAVPMKLPYLLAIELLGQAGLSI